MSEDRFQNESLICFSKIRNHETLLMRLVVVTPNGQHASTQKKKKKNKQTKDAQTG